MASVYSLPAMKSLLPVDRLGVKNVHTDAQALERVGLVVRTADKRLTAPWEKVALAVSTKSPLTGTFLWPNI
ncbi:MAG: hypothetical protein A2091_08300 [Desulfuromonadales bacterium GWD2_61_12]|nr:MAG: hypothetical protein A2091_08300 [Desulfuromonadales bacterium GWD2_61_12]